MAYDSINSGNNYNWLFQVTTPHTSDCLNIDLKLGSRNQTNTNPKNQVSILQRFLIDNYYLGIPSPTGYFGFMTLSAVKDFQVTNNKPSSGYVGSITRGLMNDPACQ